MASDLSARAITPEALLWMMALLLLVLGAATLEGLVQSFVRHRAYDWRAYAASLTDAFGRRVVDAAGLSLAAPVLAWAHAHRIASVELTTPAAMAALFIGQEFFY
jgi:hypothetical protein